MARYEYECVKCHGRFEKVLSYKDHASEAVCVCGSMAKQLFSNVNVTPDMKPFIHPHLDKKPVFIKSRRHYNEELKKRGYACVG